MTALELMPNAMQEKIINSLLEKSGIPVGQFEYSLKLRTKLLNYAKSLEEHLKRYEKSESKEDREEHLRNILDAVETYTESLMQQFFTDNATAKEKEKYMKKRRNVPSLN